MTTITCKISRELNAELDAAARRRRVAKSQIVREALEQSLPRRKSARQATAYDLVRDVCGTLRGPGDLTTNPEYMEGLGV